MKRRVLIFVQDGVGGAERMTAMVGRNLFIQSYDVCFCLVKRRGSSSITSFIPDQIRKKYIRCNNGLLSCLLFFFTILVERPAFIFSSVINLNSKLLLLKPLFGRIKFIIRCDNYLSTYSPKQRNIISYTYPYADKIIAQTEEMKNELISNLGVDVQKVIVLHNPIDKSIIDEKMQGAKNPYFNNGNKHFVAVGRFVLQKGFDLLLDAFVKAYQFNNNIELFIVGDTTVGNGDYARLIREKAIKLGVNEIVHYCGYQDNPYPYIKYADCFVLSSRWEGLPNVMIESLYLGTPVAAFMCIPIIERIVDRGVTGFLAEKNNVDDLATAMLDSLKLGRVVSTYKSASIDDFVELFSD